MGDNTPLQDLENNYRPLPSPPILPIELSGNITRKTLPINFGGDVTRIRKELPTLIEVLKKERQRKIFAEAISNNYSYFMCILEKELRKNFELLEKIEEYDLSYSKFEDIIEDYKGNLKTYDKLMEFYETLKYPDKVDWGIQQLLSYSTYSEDSQYSNDYVLSFWIELIHMLDLLAISDDTKKTNELDFLFFKMSHHIVRKAFIVYGGNDVVKKAIQDWLEDDTLEKQQALQELNHFRSELNKDQSICFAHTLRQIEIAEIYNFLNHHYEKYEGDNFCELIEGSIKRHRKLVNDFQFDKIMSWVEINRLIPIQQTESRTKRKILFLTANPKDEAQLGLERELRKVMNTLNGATNRDNFELISEPAVGIPDITRAMQVYKPQIVHFSGHGTKTKGIAIENESGEVTLFPIEGLDRLFKLSKKTVKCVVLNACHSSAQAEVISKHGIYVVGMNDEIGDEAATSFAVGFYQSLGEGNDYEFAFVI